MMFDIEPIKITKELSKPRIHNFMIGFLSEDDCDDEDRSDEDDDETRWIRINRQ